MTSDAKTVREYVESLPDDRKEPVRKIREALLSGLDRRFREEMSYGMIGYVVPLDYYPRGYHVRSKGLVPLPFINLASQKNHIALYHMGLYCDPQLLEWFIGSFREATGRKPDMGKSCIRFKPTGPLPYGLIGELAGKMDADRWIELYEQSLNL